MSNQTYLMVNESTNIVDNAVDWDGNPNTWQPPSNYLMLPQATTPAMLWEFDPTDNTKFILTEVIGAGRIGFTWNGTDLITPDPDPNNIVYDNNLTQPTTTGTQQA
jgi:hypothetical protein